jgi:pantetheine-phosphate adenylyltransferase
MTGSPRVAVCPGSFDPVTVGHEDIVRRTLRVADRVIVAVGHRATQAKQGLFPVAERLEMIRAVFADEPRVEAAEFQGLLVDFARERGASLVVRGLRGVADFEYELQMAHTNRALSPELETVFLATSAESSFVSASLVREVASLGGDVSRFVSPPVRARLLARFPLSGPIADSR